MPETAYQGRPIRKHSLAVRGASGDALNGALKVDPQDFTPGESAYIVLEIIPGAVRHDPMDDGDAWDLVQISKAKRGAMITEAEAAPFLDAVSVKLEELRVEESGQSRIGDLSLQADHEAGLHRRKRVGCSMCHPANAITGADEGDNAGDVVTAPAGSDQAAAQRDELASKRAAKAEKKPRTRAPRKPRATTTKRAPRKSTTKK